jgi:DNA-binding PadR family transcriptional regulator
MVDMYIAVAVAYGFGILTYWWGKHSAVEPTIGNMLEVLEKQGYIKTKTDANGDKELIKVT